MPTDNLRLNQPKEGTEDWHKPLNDNFETLDQHALIQVPTKSDLKNYTPHDHSFAFVESDREFFSGTGSGWVQVGYVKQTPHDVFVQSDEPDGAEEGDLWIRP